MDWFTADLHLGHANIIKYCDRPFKSLEEHDNTLIDNLNSMVDREDSLYLIGDIFWNKAGFYRNRIVCENLHFIIGSHDHASKSIKNQFKSYGHKLVLSVNETKIIMSHYPFMFWNSSHYGTIHLFGHHHGMLGRNKGVNEEGIYGDAIRLHLSRAKMMDVGVDTNNYFPYSLEKILKIMSNKKGFLLKEGERG